MQRPRGDQLTAGSLQGEVAGHGAHAQWDDDPSSGRELLDPGGGEVAGFDGHDDGVEGGCWRVAEVAVAVHDLHLRIPGLVEAGTGSVGDVGVDVDGDDVPAGADDLGDQRRLIPVGADLEDPCARLESGLFHGISLNPGCRHGTVVLPSGPRLVTTISSAYASARATPSGTNKCRGTVRKAASTVGVRIQPFSTSCAVRPDRNCSCVVLSTAESTDVSLAAQGHGPAPDGHNE